MVNSFGTNLVSNFRDKTVLITGHTGFKGSWLTAWLVKLGANVVGIALDPPTEPSHFVSAKLSTAIKDLRIDIRNQKEVENVILNVKPEYVFHLAAQSLVFQSYDNPIETWQTNVMGTINILESLRKLNNSCTAIIVTSDKCYRNIEQTEGYLETDELGGYDPYSASKGATEIAIRSYVNSYFPKGLTKLRIASARAGNVIGGGDWAVDRVIPDCVKSWSQNGTIQLRNPSATRPWQHVLEPLSGYLALALALNNDLNLHGESFNFGPDKDQDHSVLDLVKEMSIYWDRVKWEDISNIPSKYHESSLLKLDCTKALSVLKWHATMNFKETIFMTANWYQMFYANREQIQDTTNQQIDDYVASAIKKGMLWAK
jgi:CDP-glucose 4,6-dehydratase